MNLRLELYVTDLRIDAGSDPRYRYATLFKKGY